MSCAKASGRGQKAPGTGGSAFRPKNSPRRQEMKSQWALWSMRAACWRWVSNASMALPRVLPSMASPSSAAACRTFQRCKARSKASGSTRVSTSRMTVRLGTGWRLRRWPAPRRQGVAASLTAARVGDFGKDIGQRHPLFGSQHDVRGSVTILGIKYGARQVGLGACSGWAKMRLAALDLALYCSPCGCGESPGRRPHGARWRIGRGCRENAAD